MYSLISESDDDDLYFVTLDSMIDENSHNRSEIIDTLGISHIVMVAWHSGDEKNCIILRSAGCKSNVSNTDAELSQFLAKSVIDTAIQNGQNAYYEATHGPELFYRQPFTVLEIGGDEGDWNNGALGGSVAQIVLNLAMFRNHTCNEKSYYVAFGRSHCSKAVLKKSAEVGVVHYFAGSDLGQYATVDAISQIKKSNLQNDYVCKLLVHKRIGSDIKMALIDIADCLKLEIVYFK
jgi:D-tyrosyl-tRNA(Tyr) deacylase